MKKEHLTPSLRTKISAVNLKSLGISTSEISKALNVAATSITKWVRTVKEKGFSALERKKGSGRKSLLNDTQKAEVKKAVMGPPEKYNFFIWEGKTVSELIKKLFNIKISVRAALDMLHELGFSHIKPQSVPSAPKANEEERKSFIQTIGKYLKDKLVEIIYEDEVHFQLQTKTGYAWLLRGQKHSRGLKPGREKISYFGFFNVNTGQIFKHKAEKFNYETTIKALEDFLKHRPLPEGKKYVMVLDNAPWHKKMYRLVWEEKNPEYETLRKNIIPLFLPSYSPDLNPIEQVWRLTRREALNNRYFASIEDLENQLDRYFSQYEKPNKKLKSLGSFKNFTQSDDIESESESKTEDKVKNS